MSTDANARGPRPTLGHIRGLDGIRALSVLAIIAFDRGVGNRYRQAVAVLRAKGASVVPMTTHHYDSGVSTSGARGPRTTRRGWRSTTRPCARWPTPPRREPGGRVYVFDLNPVASAGRRYEGSVGPVNVRCTDGVQFTRSGGICVGLRPAPELAALGQPHAAASPGGTWPGSLPPSTPSWFANLPCQ